ncbi:putative G protein alpha subunit, helical insertion [Helianthus annuus]|nr:putative G protein alpha subunit, helical insertion [Helianthus annuus]KAJ0935695.1 putative G protein alpha subunit, helical insertion [Helianthus annuus]KAJ0943614.1 putative G protein alpha subunit, helical insertion [Helianthus annuus]
MSKILRSILPNHSSKKVEDDEYNVEYSFATEYSGPPVSYEIPKAVPVDVGSIPTASVVSTPVNSGNLSLPVIYPVVKRRNEFVSSEIKETSLHQPGSLEKEGSSASSGFSDSQENSHESSMSSDVEGLDNDCHEIEEVSASEDDERTDQEVSNYDTRTQIVTFLEPESSAMVHDESGYDESGSMMQERPHANLNIKKGLCHYCLKGNRFTKKECCIVCDAKYCSKCVLRVMGYMPEGRKCITCIGYPIDESKRGQLGKCSSVLKQVLADFQVEQVMLAEKSCQVNQAPHWLIYVNGNHLSLEEAYQLQTCSHPPKGLVPGFYWYDKLSGFWGKEGKKPSQIITPGLSIGGMIMKNASNGSTNVIVNNRVITKRELWMLKVARINHKGSPSYWVSHNGSYQEEGQNQQQNGKIWEKRGIKMACVLLSLPMPPKSFISSEEEVVNGSQQKQKKTDTKPLTKILLVGQDQSGISAIYKQAKILYRVPFSEDERKKVKSLIQRNLYLYISILLEGLKQFEEDYSIQIGKKPIDQPGTSAAGSSVDDIELNVYSLSGKLNKFSEWLLQIVESGDLDVIFPAATREYAAVVEELWKDKAFQATYARRDELPALPIVADYFLPRAAEISCETYEPSDEDILYADGITSSNGITSMEFSVSSSPPNSFMDATEQSDTPLQRYELIRVNSSNLGYNCKWLSMFEDVDLILYCVDLTSYNEYFHDNNLNLKNKMLESRNIFENIVTNPRFKNKAFLLILNKYDLLEKKIKTTPLTQCEWFHDFNPFITNHSYDDGNSNNNNNASVAQYAFQYIAAKFKKLFCELTGRKLYVSPVTGLEGGSVDAALKYGKEVLMWVNEENKPIASTNEWSSASTEAETTI